MLILGNPPSRGLRVDSRHRVLDGGGRAVATYTVGMRAVVLFSIVRVAAFVVPFAILLAIGLIWWVAALIAAVLGFCVSYIFLRPLRDRVALKLVEARGIRAASADERAEDAPTTTT